MFYFNFFARQILPLNLIATKGSRDDLGPKLNGNPIITGIKWGDSGKDFSEIPSSVLQNVEEYRRSFVDPGVI